MILSALVSVGAITANTTLPFHDAVGWLHEIPVLMLPSTMAANGPWSGEEQAPQASGREFESRLVHHRTPWRAMKARLYTPNRRAARRAILHQHANESH